MRFSLYVSEGCLDVPGIGEGNGDDVSHGGDSDLAVLKGEKVHGPSVGRTSYPAFSMGF